MVERARAKRGLTVPQIGYEKICKWGMKTYGQTGYEKNAAGGYEKTCRRWGMKKNARAGYRGN